MEKTMNTQPKLLTTKELANITGFSTSYFEKGRVLGYGPAWIKLRGAVRYRIEDYEAWLASERVVQGGSANV
jgi:predicted DNA-binding transcriptional regulator AlpA